MTHSLTRKIVVASAVGAFSLGAVACSSDAVDDDIEEPVDGAVDDVDDAGDDVGGEMEDVGDEMEEVVDTDG